MSNITAAEEITSQREGTVMCRLHVPQKLGISRDAALSLWGMGFSQEARVTGAPGPNEVKKGRARPGFRQRCWASNSTPTQTVMGCQKVLQSRNTQRVLDAVRAVRSDGMGAVLIIEHGLALCQLNTS